jgi:16S rRNA (cytosine1402-N4)-methyltransferase
VVDATVGLGGHAVALLEKIGPPGRLIAIDRDGESLQLAKEKLKAFSAQCHFIQEDFRHIDRILKSLGIQEVDAIVFDLGVSSYQLNNPERGFSIKLDGPLDMRIDKQSFISAYDLVNSLSEREIASILKNFGQERFSNRIAHFLVQERIQHPIETTNDLTRAILKAIPYRYQRQKIHPATRTFQAFRIAVNRELEAMEIALDRCVPCLKKGGRIAVIAFHSLEDRIVKEKFRQYGRERKMVAIFKKPLRPSPQENQENPRARSARLRVAERIPLTDKEGAGRIRKERTGQ